MSGQQDFGTEHGIARDASAQFLLRQTTPGRRLLRQYEKTDLGVRIPGANLIQAFTVLLVEGPLLVVGTDQVSHELIDNPQGISNNPRSVLLRLIPRGLNTQKRLGIAGTDSTGNNIVFSGSFVRTAGLAAIFNNTQILSFRADGYAERELGSEIGTASIRIERVEKEIAKHSRCLEGLVWWRGEQAGAEVGIDPGMGYGSCPKMRTNKLFIVGNKAIDFFFTQHTFLDQQRLESQHPLLQRRQSRSAGIFRRLKICGGLGRCWGGDRWQPGRRTGSQGGQAAVAQKGTACDP